MARYARQPRHQRQPRRFAAILAIGVVLAGWGAADRAKPPPLVPAGPRRRLADFGMPVAAPATALSSSWFCAFASASSAGPTPGTVSIVNPQPAAVTGTVTFMRSDGGADLSQPVSVPARSRLDVTENVPGAASYLAALVNLDSGGVGVEQALVGTAGPAGGPCATSAATQWHFADGSTAKDNTLLIGLFNPFPDDAVADMAFTTEQGREPPVAALQALPVPARSLVVVDIGQHLRRRDHVATSITTRVGRIVGAELQIQQPAAGIIGQALLIGSGQPEPSWTYADGVASSSISETWRLYNPTTTDARVQVRFTLDGGGAVPPSIVDVPAQGTATVAADQATGIPARERHATQFDSLDGVGIVISRAYQLAPASGSTAFTESTGASRPAAAWLFALGERAAGGGESISLFNPGQAAVRVTVTALTGAAAATVPGLDGVTVLPGQRLLIQLGRQTQALDLPLLVQASAPVVAERLDAPPAAGLVDGMGIPLLG